MRTHDGGAGVGTVLGVTAARIVVGRGVVEMTDKQSSGLGLIDPNNLAEFTAAMRTYATALTDSFSVLDEAQP